MNLPHGARVYLDSNIFIYLLEGHPSKSEHLKRLNQGFEEGTWFPVSSTLALAECVTKPMKEANTLLEQRYRSVFEDWGKLAVISITDTILMEGVRIRVKWGLGLLDAIHAASAQSAGCQTILSADGKFRRYTDLPVIGLDALT